MCLIWCTLPVWCLSRCKTHKGAPMSLLPTSSFFWPKFSVLSPDFFFPLPLPLPLCLFFLFIVLFPFSSSPLLFPVPFLFLLCASPHPVPLYFSLFISHISVLVCPLVLISACFLTIFLFPWEPSRLISLSLPLFHLQRCWPHTSHTPCSSSCPWAF